MNKEKKATVKPQRLSVFFNRHKLGKKVPPARHPAQKTMGGILWPDLSWSGMVYFASP
jgi:hypothetical protein